MQLQERVSLKAPATHAQFPVKHKTGDKQKYTNFCRANRKLPTCTSSKQGRCAVSVRSWAFLPWCCSLESPSLLQSPVLCPCSQPLCPCPADSRGAAEPWEPARTCPSGTIRSQGINLCLQTGLGIKTCMQSGSVYCNKRFCD